MTALPEPERVLIDKQTPDVFRSYLDTVKAVRAALTLAELVTTLPPGHSSARSTATRGDG